MTDGTLARIRAAGAGEAVSLDALLTLFRVPKARFRWGQSYAIDRHDSTVLVDAVHAVTRGAVEALLTGGTVPPVEALLLTHSDLLGQAWGSPQELSDWLGAPVLIHHADAQGTEARTFGGPTPGEGDRLLARLGVAAFHVPGHTPGSAVFVDGQNGSVFCGDAAIGPSYDARTAPGVSEWTHPPISSADWPAFVAAWKRVSSGTFGHPPHVFQQAQHGILPLHGQPVLYVDPPDIDPGPPIGHLGRPFLDALRLGGAAVRLPRGASYGAFGRPLLDPTNTMRA